MAGEIPPSVAKFIRRYISSVAQLEILLLLRGAPDESWTADRAGREMYTPPEAAARCLDTLASYRLLTSSEEGAYRYQPKTRDLARTVEELADVYARRRHRVITLIFSEPDDPARSFSDAFRFRRPDEDEKKDEEE